MEFKMVGNYAKDVFRQGFDNSMIHQQCKIKLYENPITPSWDMGPWMFVECSDWMYQPFEMNFQFDTMSVNQYRLYNNDFYTFNFSNPVEIFGAFLTNDWGEVIGMQEFDSPSLISSLDYTGSEIIISVT